MRKPQTNEILVAVTGSRRSYEGNYQPGNSATYTNSYFTSKRDSNYKTVVMENLEGRNPDVMISIKDSSSEREGEFN